MTTAVTPALDADLEKEARLKALIAGYGTLAVAYSGGVDSSYLADIAHDVLSDRASLILADSPSIPRSEVNEAKALAESRAWNLRILYTDEFENDAYLANDGTRCYHCRSELFEKMQQYAERERIAVLAYGAITDDMLDPTRLGHRAAQEFSIVAPLVEAGLGKDEIRRLSGRRNLPTADKASFACLSSRFPVGTPVTREDVAKVEQAEEVLKALGFRQYRARHHGDVCRLELEPAEFSRVLEPSTRDRLVRGIRAAGYRHVALDLLGYRTGSAAGLG